MISKAWKKNSAYFPGVTLLILGMAFGGCGTPRGDLERLNREQSATLESLSREIKRLNLEITELLAQSGTGLSQAKSGLEKGLQGELSRGELSLSVGDRGLVVTVLDRVLFDSGKAVLKPEARRTLQAVAKVLNSEAAGHSIYVEGHTDNQPIQRSGWRSNWELSMARAAEVVHYFAESCALAPQRLAATGYGEHQPVVSNDTPEGRDKNRRVEIVVSPKKVEGVNS